jgi:hypothetical protein
MSSKWELKLQEWGLYYGIFVIQLEKKSWFVDMFGFSFAFHVQVSVWG